MHYRSALRQGIVVSQLEIDGLVELCAQLRAWSVSPQVSTSREKERERVCVCVCVCECVCVECVWSVCVCVFVLSVCVVVVIQQFSSLLLQ